MGLKELIFGKKPAPQKGRRFEALSSFQPPFVAYNASMYETEIIRAAISANATHTSKLKIEFRGHGSKELSARLRRPNGFATWSQFLYRLRTVYDNDNNAFICPTFDRYGRVTAIYPVLPANAEVVDVNGEPWLAFQFAAGQFAQAPVWQVAMMRNHQYKNDFFGESNAALNSTLQLVDIQNQGITQAVKDAATFRFMAQYNALSYEDDLEQEQKEFNKASAGRGGLVKLFPSTWSNIKQIESKPFVMDAATMGAIDKRVYAYFGVNEDILENKAYGDKWTAYYEGSIEPFAIQLSEVLTELFILCGELSGPDAMVMATANRLQYMATREKLSMIGLVDRGAINRDEYREVWNMPPIPDGSGKEYIIRGEYKNAADQVITSTGGDDDE